MRTPFTNPDYARTVCMAFRAISAVLRTLFRLADAGRMQQAVRQLNSMTDADLNSRGLTRSGEVDRIFD